MEARATVPLPLPQRRDQHRARQQGVDESARSRTLLAGAGRHQGHRAHPARRHERLRLARQRVRISRYERHVAAASDGHPRAGIVQRQKPDFRRFKGVLRILFHPDGTLGRPRRTALLRRAVCRRNARSQRPASQPLHHHETRHDGSCQRGRRDGFRTRRHRGERPFAARQNIACRHARKPHLLRRRDQRTAR